MKNRLSILEWAPGIEIEVIDEEAVYNEPPNKEIINEINNQHIVDVTIVRGDENNAELSNNDGYSSDNEESLNVQEQDNGNIVPHIEENIDTIEDTYNSGQMNDENHSVNSDVLYYKANGDARLSLHSSETSQYTNQYV